MRTVLSLNGKTDTERLGLGTTVLIAGRSIASNGWNILTPARCGYSRQRRQDTIMLFKGDCGKAEKWKLSKRLTAIAQRIAFTGCTLTAQHITADTVLPRDIQEDARCPSVTSTSVASEE